MADLKIALVLDLDDRASRGLQRAGRQVAKTGDNMKQSFSLAADMKLAADGIQQFSGLAQRAIRGPIDAFVGFEAQMKKVGSVARATPKELEQLTKEAQRLGALQTSPFSAGEIGEGMFTLSQAGLSVTEQMAAMEDVLNLAVAAQEDLGSTGALATNIMGAFQLEASEMAQVGDVLTQAFTSSDTSLAALGETMKQVGPAAKAAGQDLATTAALASQLASAGVKGSQAGTALSTIMQRLQAPEKRGKVALRRLGVQPIDETGALKPIEEVFSDLGASLEKLGTAERAGVIGDIFGREASVVSAANILSDAASRGELQQRLGASRQQAAGGGLSKEVAESQTETAEAQIAAFDAAVQGLKVTIGKELTPLLLEMHEGLKPIIEDLGEWVKENPETVRQIGKFVGALALVGAPLGTLVLSMSAITSVSRLAIGPLGAMASAAGLIGNKAGSAKGPIKALSGTIGSKAAKAGLVGASLAAGFALGSLIDRIFGFSDKISGVNQSQQRRVGADDLQNISEAMTPEERKRRKQILEEIENPDKDFMQKAADFTLTEFGQKTLGVGTAAREEELRTELAQLENRALMRGPVEGERTLEEHEDPDEMRRIRERNNRVARAQRERLDSARGEGGGFIAGTRAAEQTITVRTVIDDNRTTTKVEDENGEELSSGTGETLQGVD